MFHLCDLRFAKVGDGMDTGQVLVEGAHSVDRIEDMLSTLLSMIPDILYFQVNLGGMFMRNFVHLLYVRNCCRTTIMRNYLTTYSHNNSQSTGTVLEIKKKNIEVLSQSNEIQLN